MRDTHIAMAKIIATGCERIYREVKMIMMIGGSGEIMKDLATKELRI